MTSGVITAEAEAPAERHALLKLFAGADLSREEARTLFRLLVDGALDGSTIAALLVALKLKGETAEEMTGAALALREAACAFPRPDYLFADTCGTGGDGAGTINVSTTAAFVCAAAGLPIVKHGNRSVTSRSGSADVLEALGAKLDLSPEASRRVLDDTGICFLLAPAYHPGLRHAGPVRRMLGVRTIMNSLGPCVNPARPRVQLLGVAAPSLIDPVARTLAALGVERALVVHGGGIDEVALHDRTEARLVADGAVRALSLHPDDAGLKTFPLSSLRGGGADENAERLRACLNGAGGEADRAAVSINAGALLMTSGRAATLKEGVSLAQDTLRSGAAARVLTSFVEATHA